MAVPLILCRLKADHSTVHAIGETALIYFPDWEPVPVERQELPEPEPVPKPVTRTKAAGPAAKEKE